MSEQGKETRADAPTRGSGDPRRLLNVVKRPPYRNALVIVAVAITMASLFAASYSLVLGRATPHHLPTGLVGDPARRPQLVNALKRATRGALEYQPLPSIAAARTAINEQKIYAALVLEPGKPRLLISSASGVSVARVLEQATLQVAQHVSPPIAIVDLHPLPPADPQGLVAFYVTLAATILGFTSMFQLAAHAPQLSLRAWLAFVVVLAVLGGLSLALVTDPLIGALRGAFTELWFSLTGEVAAAALFSSAMRCLLRAWAIVPTWLLFVVLGNTSSGGAVAPPLLPPVFAFIGRFLPPGATVNILRRAVYFPHEQHIEPFLVQAGWIICALAGLLLCARLGHKRPAE
ncbi:MAG: hypothetical protein QOE54_3760 [Streptosporangiaceae bacterium]|jgi:hypothetical protein|nr:rane protein [Streptosporangiaceae bacterium]MDX6431394.1 hypothetical protein [Streptosporangiaceae bacterium]